MPPIVTTINDSASTEIPMFASKRINVPIVPNVNLPPPRNDKEPQPYQLPMNITKFEGQSKEGNWLFIEEKRKINIETFEN